MKKLDVSNKNLTNLDDYDLSEVEELYCYNNILTSLPELPKVENLYCYNNNIFYSKEIVDRFDWDRLFSSEKEYEQWHEDYNLQQKINNFLEC